MKILLIRLSAIGDVVRTLPALAGLRRALPEATLDWVVEEASAGILRDQPDLDHVIVFPRRILARALLHPAEIGRARAAIASFVASLRESRYDAVVDFQGTLKTGLMSILTGAPRRIGLGPGHAREMSWIFYNDRVDLPRRRMNRMERSQALVERLGARPGGSGVSRLAESPADAARVESFLASIGPAGAPCPAPLVVFPGTSRAQSYKRYPPESFARAADLVTERTGAPVVVAWGPGEEDLAAAVAAEMRAPAVVAPPLTLGELTALIRRCRAFLSGDTGPMHIAWTVGAPVVAVYGPTDPVVNRPGGDLSAVAYRKVACSPCRNRGCIARTCLEDLPAATVADAALDVIRRAEGSRTGARAGVGPGAADA